MVECVRVGPAAGDGRDPQRAAVELDGNFERSRAVVLGDDAVGPDQREAVDAQPLNGRSRHNRIARLNREDRARSFAVHRKGQPRTVGHDRAAGSDGVLECRDR